jgi:hypothetical protein
MARNRLNAPASACLDMHTLSPFLASSSARISREPNVMSSLLVLEGRLILVDSINAKQINHRHSLSLQVTT